MVKRKTKATKVNPFDKKGSSKKRKNAIPVVRNRGGFNKDKKQRFKLLDSSDSETTGLNELIGSNKLRNGTGTEQSEASELSEVTTNRTKKEVMSEVIAKSKSYRAERKQEKQLFETQIEDIDEQFMQILASLPRRTRNKELPEIVPFSSKVEVTGEGVQKDSFEKHTSIESKELYFAEDNRNSSPSKMEDSDTTSRQLLSKTNNMHSHIPERSKLKLRKHSSQTLENEGHFEPIENNAESSVERNSSGTGESNLSALYIPETFTEFMNRILPNDILQEQYLDALMSQAVEKQKNNSAFVNSDQLLGWMFDGLEEIALQSIHSNERMRRLEATKAIIQRIRILMSTENVEQLEYFVEKVTAELSEPLTVVELGEEGGQANSNSIFDLSYKMNFKLFLLLFSVSRLSSLKNIISPTIQNLIFLLGQWLTRMKVSCLHQIRKGLSLIQLFLPHIEAAECFVPEFLTFCYSIVGLFTKEDSRVKDSFILYNFLETETLQHMIKQTITNDTWQEWNAAAGIDMLLDAFTCDNVSCKSLASCDWEDVFNSLRDLFVTCRDVTIRLCAIFHSCDAFPGLIFPVLQELREILKDEQIIPSLRAEAEIFFSKLEEMNSVFEETGLKPLQLYYNKLSLPVEYEPKLKDSKDPLDNRHLKKQIRKEKKKTMKWLRLETNRQQEEKMLKRRNEDIYRATRAQEAVAFLQLQQQTWNKQEKKWKNMNNSL